MPVPRPSTPPSPLSSPSLTELGLSLAVLTKHLSPSHFSTPPTSGAFLSPHYLLLCHAQGLDVLPLVSPPTPAPYALIRRVSFKSVVVMEHRGVLVAISGRRDGVRVYALDEIKKAVEWRLDVEIRREREKLRREEAKRPPPRDSASNDVLSLEKTSPPNTDKCSSLRSSPSTRKGSQRRKAKTPPQTPIQSIFSPPPAISHPPLGPPPSYTSVTPPLQPLRQRSTSSVQLARGRSTSVNDVLRGTISRRATEILEMDNNRDADMKADWMEGSHSDDEAINVVAAGASGSQALDERTSSIVPVESTTSNVSGMDGAASHRARPVSTTTLTPAGFHRATRPSELDLSRARVEPRPAIPQSPTPTLITLRHALASSPPTGPAHTMNSMTPRLTDSPIPDQDLDDQALLESRLPDLPPLGTRLPQQAILITQSHLVATGEEDVPSSPVSLNSQSSRARQSNDTLGSRRRRRRWSVLDGILPGATGQPDVQLPTTPLPWESQDARTREHPDQRPPSSSPIAPAQSRSSDVAEHPPPLSAHPHSRFFSRILGNPFSHRRSEDGAVPVQFTEHADGTVRKQGPTPPPAPAPKLEYVKLPGTKGSIMIKAVETSRKRYVVYPLPSAACRDTGNTAFSLFCAETTGKRLNFLLALIGRRSGSRARSFYQILPALWNYNCRAMTLWKFSSSSHRMCLDSSLLLFGCARSDLVEQKEEQHAGVHANSKWTIFLAQRWMLPPLSKALLTLTLGLDYPSRPLFLLSQRSRLEPLLLATLHLPLHSPTWSNVLPTGQH